MAPNEQMQVIGLDSELTHTPLVLCYQLLNDSLQWIMYQIFYYFSSPFRTEKNMIDNQMTITIITFVFYVDTLSQNEGFSKNVLLLPQIKNGFSSRMNDETFKPAFL
jgi:hypothetical protein